MLTVGMSRVDPLQPHLKHITDRSATIWTFGSLAHSVSSGKSDCVCLSVCLCLSLYGREVTVGYARLSYGEAWEQLSAI